MIVCITGMHRTGTSMVSRLLNLCGLYLGEEQDLIPGAEDNPEGFWENKKFHQINEDILSTLGGSWDMPPEFKKGWENSEMLSELRIRAKKAIDEMAGHGDWGWKDPRNSLTLPFWRKLIPDFKTVICLRNPFEVYQSLARRGYSSSRFTYALWLTYNQMVLAFTKPEARIITHYDAYFQHPQVELKRLADFLGMNATGDVIDAACASTIKETLKHHQAGIRELMDTKALKPMIALYKKMSQDAGPVFLQTIKNMEEEYIETAEVSEETEKEKLRALVKKLEDEIIQTNQRLIETEKRIADLEREKDTLERESQEIKAYKSELREEEAKFRIEKARFEEQAAKMREEQDKLLELRNKLLEEKSKILKESVSFKELKLKLEEANMNLHNKVAEIQEANEVLKKKIIEIKSEYPSHQQKNTILKQTISELRERNELLQTQFEHIHQSHSWRFMQFFQNIRLFFVPVGSTQEKVLRWLLNLLTLKFLRDFLRRALRGGAKGLATRAQNRIKAATQPTGESAALSLPAVYAGLVKSANSQTDSDFVPLTDEHFDSKESLVKLLAFYLPQYHPIPENDEWWGKGFTEWMNVSKAIPQFVGHYQPRLPGELGFYDLRIPEVQQRQIDLAKQYGIHGFVFYYYWFNGKRLLEKPLEIFLKSKNNFPFCLCWANENWSRRWDGSENELLIAQHHSPESDLRFIQDIRPIFEDERYIRINGRPLLIVYRPNIIPDVKNTVSIWRESCEKNGCGNPYLLAVQSFWFHDPREVEFDAALQFPPHNIHMTDIQHKLDICNPDYRGRVVDYIEVVRKTEGPEQSDYKLFKTIFPGWDNEARKPGRGYTFANSSPALYNEWLEHTAAYTMREPDADKQLLFINAWNEWGEAAYLEPDRRYGYAYLQATMEALKTVREWNKPKE